jgi:hypothetical protein
VTVRTLALLLALLAAPAQAAPNQAEVRATAREALDQLSDEDVEGARALLAPLDVPEPADPMVQLALGVLRFHEQRYP